MAKETTNWGVFALEFIGSLFFLAVVFTTSGAYMNTSWGAAALWLPLLYGIGVVGALALFFVSFGNLIPGIDEKAVSAGAMKATLFTSIVLAALTYGNTTYFATVLIGFIIAFIGSGLGYKK
jgi:multisubunit Na+/H+ antiporter MnhF subunit